MYCQQSLCVSFIWYLFLIDKSELNTRNLANLTPVPTTNKKSAFMEFILNNHYQIVCLYFSVFQLVLTFFFHFLFWMHSKIYFGFIWKFILDAFKNLFWIHLKIYFGCIWKYILEAFTNLDTWRKIFLKRVWNEIIHHLKAEMCNCFEIDYDYVIDRQSCAC